MRTFRFVLSLTLLLMLMCPHVPALAEDTYFTLYNFTGLAISELHINSDKNRISDGRIRNSDYIFDHHRAQVFYSTNEFLPGRNRYLHICLCNYEPHLVTELPTELEGNEFSITLSPDRKLVIDRLKCDPYVEGALVGVQNNSASSIDEVFIYPSGAIGVGENRINGGWIRSLDARSFIAMSGLEKAVNTTWDIKLHFVGGNGGEGKYVYIYRQDFERFEKYDIVADGAYPEYDVHLQLRTGLE